jgi:hypothetical protein
VKKSANEPATEYTTRPTAEEQLLEDREFGSLPVVKVPKVSHGAASERAAPFPSNRAGTRNQRMDVTSKPAYHVNDFDRNSDTIDVVVRTSNMASPVTKSMPNKKRQSRGGQNKGLKRNYNTNSGASNTTQPQRTRKPSNFHRQDSNNSNQTSRTAGGNPWTNRSNQSHNTTSPWGRRADPVH